MLVGRLLHYRSTSTQKLHTSFQVFLEAASMFEDSQQNTKTSSLMTKIITLSSIASVIATNISAISEHLHHTSYMTYLKNMHLKATTFSDCSSKIYKAHNFSTDKFCCRQKNHKFYTAGDPHYRCVKHQLHTASSNT